MERIAFSVLIIFFSASVAFAAEPVQTPPQTGASAVTPQPISFEQCNKMFKLNSEKLFYLSLSSANANRFTIDEIQSKSGYILFSAGGKQYLATVLAIDGKNSLLKITPVNNSYYFPIGVVSNFFKYIELNINTPVEKIW